MLGSHFDKMQAYRPADLLKRHSNIGVFLTVIMKFLRTAILKNIWTAASESFSFNVSLNLSIHEQITWWTSRSSHRRCSVRKSALRNFAKFTGKYLCQSPFLIKLQGAWIFLKKRLWHGVFWWILRNFWERHL